MSVSGSNNLNASGGDERVARLARIEGRVQGVGYRYWAANQAESLGLDGYVRNLTDGSVEALLIGHPADLARMLTWLEDGPSAARVDRVIAQPPPDDAWRDWLGFKRLRTAPPGALA